MCFTIKRSRSNFCVGFYRRNNDPEIKLQLVNRTRFCVKRTSVQMILPISLVIFIAFYLSKVLAEMKFRQGHNRPKILRD